MFRTFDILVKAILILLVLATILMLSIGAGLSACTPLILLGVVIAWPWFSYRKRRQRRLDASKIA
ncbi:hypothetical protein [Pseudomonas sp. SID14000]|uniref:hypothetical protein n=1 Tax=Pseudomonas sp. SID14000 TaxID=1986221 RepID=UPI000B3C079B|nr:hypothetical protein [Pseudomonas sp. SID14000]